MAQLIERPLPENIEAEIAVLGSMLLEGERLADILGYLEPKDFKRKAHQTIIEAMRELYQECEGGAGFDIVLLKEKLRELEQQGKISPHDSVESIYLVQLLEGVPSAANAEYYSNLVMKKSTLRRLHKAMYDADSKVFIEGADPEEIASDLIREVFDVTARMRRKKNETGAEISQRVIEKILTGKQMEGVMKTGIRSLDEQLLGLFKKNLILIAARPGHGKSGLASEIVQKAAVDGVENEDGIVEQKKILIVPLEMSHDEFLERMICSRAEVSLTAARTGKFEKDEDLTKLTKAASEICASADNMIFDDTLVTPMKLETTAKELKATQGLDMIVVDYLQLMEISGKTQEMRQQQISKISRSLKNLARELDIPVIALSQLNREVEQTEDKEPQIYHLRESGSLEQDADVVLMLMRPECYNSMNRPGECLVFIRKFRNGQTGKVTLKFIDKYVKFTDLYHYGVA